MSELSRLRGSEGCDACDDDNQQELIDKLKERETAAAGHLPPEGEG